MANTQKVMTLEDTAKLIAKVHANATGGAKFEYDNAKGEYGNIAAYMAAHKDGKVYGVKYPKPISNKADNRPPIACFMSFANGSSISRSQAIISGIAI